MEDIDKFLAKTKALNTQLNTVETAISCKDFMSKLISKIFKSENIEIPPKSTLIEQIDSPLIKEYSKNNSYITNSLHYIRKLGALATQGFKVKKSEAKLALQHLELFYNFSISKDFIENDCNIEYSPLGYMTEAKTRKLYVDLYLKEAKWSILETQNVALASSAGIEIEVDNMPNLSNTGYCDYVLYGRDAMPLAIVEAKKTSEKVEKGRHQAELYGKSMELKYGRIPILYYTNGYEIFCIDGIYPPRRVSGFHTEEELELLLQRRNRESISNIKIDDNISNRYYQKKAITAICENLNKNKRKSLLVMATGTGKTRLAISLVDVLAKNNWVKNVLFLADRTSLVSQAADNFKDLLPSFPATILSENNIRKNLDDRLIFSTYQTMINYIDNEVKQFSIGRFDLIIIDEAHRSIFNKYATIFDYFDSFLVGLTATPKNDVDTNTYQIFDCENGEPTASYDIEEAVKDEYLVPYKVLNLTTTVLRQGVKYAELSEIEKKQIEENLPQETPSPEFTIPQTKIFRQVYNTKTCDLVLEELMNKGFKVESGQLLAKTIIFAYNHDHAQMIVDRFNILYPEYKGEYAKLIDNYVPYANDLIKEFKTKKDFRIAVSVDMLDTGIDVPEVLNLVFFKPVKSKVKFVQMIGRGTRLCPNVFGYKEDKKHFLIFDYCDNFNYFSENIDKVEGSEKSLSLSQRLFNLRLQILCELQGIRHQEIDFNREYYLKLKEILHSEIIKIKSKSARIQVRNLMHFVDKYYDKNTWQNISPLMRAEIERNLTELIDSDIEEIDKVLAFDARMLYIEISMLIDNSTNLASKHIRKIREVSQFLLDQKASIPLVLARSKELKILASDKYWESPSLHSLEDMRESIRELMQFLDTNSHINITINIKDEIELNGDEVAGTIDIRTYKQKVLDYLISHSDSKVIKKIKNLETISDIDLIELEDVLWNELGTKEEYDKTVENNNNIRNGNLAVFIRSLVGLEQRAINEKFGDFLNGNILNSDQQEYLKSIIDYVQENGNISKIDLLETNPFDTFDVQSIFGEKMPILLDIVNLINTSVMAA